jgi:subtilisin family serine protease
MARTSSVSRASSGRRRTQRRGLFGLAVLASVLALVAPSAPAGAAPAAPGSGVATAAKTWTATPLTGTLVQGAKSATGRLAKNDARLLRLTSSTPVHVVVKLDYDSLAAYRGGVPGFAATSPAATGRPLDPRSDSARRYTGYIGNVEATFLTALRARVPAATPGRSLQLVYGGVAVTLPGNRVADLLTLPGVAAVQADELAQPLTDASPAFIGAPTVYSQLGGSANSGKGVIVGVLDTGAWPEHPSYVDPGTLPAPPPTTDGNPRVCNFGDNPLTPASDPFVCNHKLISGQPFLATYNAVIGGEVYPDSARDSDGHGTHTSTTSAGGPVASANPLGIDRGAIHGIAPAAHVAVYKVCGAQGCFQSDTAAAVARAILDRVRVINFSISGGSDPYSDPVELSFLDAYAAGVLVSASAGNSGPDAGTTDHRGPWVTTVAASMQSRTFQSTVTLSGGGATATISGSSITSGVSSALPVVLASAAPYSNALCTAPAPAGLFTGKIVACQRGAGRVMKGFNVLQGGAAGMLLYNPVLAETMTDNHWLPTVHLEQPEGAALLAFLAAHPGATARFTTGAKTTWQGDVMTSFSSRGPGGDFLKPDVTAPGLQILAGNSPTPDDPSLGPPGNLFQAIAGTSMSAPHVTGSAALLFALHPDWTPGQVKSALETTGKTSVVKHDRVTPADPFDMGGGRIDLTKAGNPGLTFDETATNFAASAVAAPADRIDLNLPSVNAPTMPGAIATSRVAKNVSGRNLTYRVTTTSPAGTKITVSPSVFTLLPGRSARLAIVISARDAAPGQYFGRIDLDQLGGSRDPHLPVAFFKQQGVVTLDQSCAPTTIPLGSGRSTCTVTVQNNALQQAGVVAESHLDSNLRLTAVNGATQLGPRDVTATATLAARQPDAPTIAPGPTPAGYIPLDAFGVAPIPIGDEQALNFTVPAFVFAGQTYNRLGVTSNGYSVAGGAAGADIAFNPQTLPDPAPPNGVLAPFWTDLDGAGAPGVFAATLTDGLNDWVVVEWRLNLFGTTSGRVFQQWIGVNGSEDITFTYDPGNLPAAPPATYGLTVGAENAEGSAGAQIAGPPTVDLRVTSTPGAPGGSLTYSFELRGTDTGVGDVTTTMATPLVRGVTTEVDRITVS